MTQQETKKIMQFLMNRGETLTSLQTIMQEIEKKTRDKTYEIDYSDGLTVKSKGIILYKHK